MSSEINLLIINSIYGVGDKQGLLSSEAWRLHKCCSNCRAGFGKQQFGKNGP